MKPIEKNVLSDIFYLMFFGTSSAKNDYEKAFESWLAEYHIPFSRLPQTRRANILGHSLKTFDYLVFVPNKPTYLVELKGRVFSGSRFSISSALQRWVFQHDLDSLARWQTALSANIEPVKALFVFAYRLQLPCAETERFQAYPFEEYRYVFLSIDCESYRQYSSRRSLRWHTVDCPFWAFRRYADALSERWQLDVPYCPLGNDGL